jgi:hypothetical protein
MQLDGVEADAQRALGGIGEAVLTFAMSSSVMAAGVCQPGPNGSADGPMVGQASSAAVSALAPSHGRADEALRPAWANWIAIFAVPMWWQ